VGHPEIPVPELKIWYGQKLAIPAPEPSVWYAQKLAIPAPELKINDTGPPHGGPGSFEYQLGLRRSASGRVSIGGA